MKKALKIIIPVVLVAIIAIVFISVNSKHNHEKAVAFPAREFAEVYDKNPIKAESDYVGKRFFLDCKIVEINTDEIVLFHYDDSLPEGKVCVKFPIRQIKKKMRDKAKELSVGQAIEVEGTLKKGTEVSIKEDFVLFGEVNITTSGDVRLKDVVFRDITE